MAIEAIAALTEAQVGELCELYQKEWWSKERQGADVRRMLAHTDAIVAFCDADTRRLVGFARILTDHVYKALVFDVIVAESHRGQGVGRALMDAIMGHPLVRSVEHVELYCLPKHVPFYEKWSFSQELGPLRFMRATRK